MLAGEGDYSLWVYNYLIKKEIPIERLIIEKPVPRKIFLKARIKKIGVLNVLGQLMHRIIIVPFLKLASKKRMTEIISRGGFDASVPNNTGVLANVSSVNSDECLTLLKEIEPELVIVVNTRIISRKILSGIKTKFVNIHAGITPKYRGWHGAYWALVNKDKENCGVTIHLVDEGVDTGNILYQSKIEITNRDNYFTYPLLQLEKGLPIFYKAAMDILEGRPQRRQNNPDLPDGLYSHPTIWSYIWNRIFKAVK